MTLQLPLLPGEVRLWHAPLDEPVGALDDCLSPDEIVRRDRFAFPHLRTRFARGRGLLRWVLAHYLAVEPDRLQFTYGPQGKPALLDEPLKFNLSHSDDRWLLAVSLDREVGVDIEGARKLYDMEAMVRRFFAPGERLELFALAPEERAAAFFRGWTRKEALMKVTGQGMSLALDAFDVTLGAKEARLLAHRPDPSALLRWQLVDVAAPDGFVAALAVDGHDARVWPARELPPGWPFAPNSI